MPAPLLLVPPSEGKAQGGVRSKGLNAFGRSLGHGRSEVLDALSTEMGTRRGKALERLLNARGSLLEDAKVATAELCAGTSLLLPAWQRFTGVVWDHLDPASLEQRHLDRLLIPTGPYGLSRGTDSIADFRLGMSVSLGTLGVLSRYWNPLVTREISKTANGALVIDLLPAEHGAAVDFESLAESVDLLRVRFLAADGAKAAGHGAKAVKGILARRLLEQGADRLGSFRWEGWRASRSGGDLEVVAPGTP